MKLLRCIFSLALLLFLLVAFPTLLKVPPIHRSNRRNAALANSCIHLGVVSFRKMNRSASCDSKDGASLSTEKKLGPTSSAISLALESNVNLQAELKRRLVKVRRLQAQNRRDAADVTSSLSQCWDRDPDYAFDANASCAHSLDEDTKSAAATRITSDIIQTPVLQKVTSKWECNPNRKWTRGFFVDPFGSTPAVFDNATTGEHVDQDVESDSTDFLPAAWTKAEVKEFQSVIEQVRGNTEKKATGHTQQRSELFEDDAFFEEVASKLHSNPPRSAEECRAAYFTFDPVISTAKFTKEESLFIVNAARELGEGEPGGSVDWYEVSAKLNAKFCSQNANGISAKRRTPWQCFQHYRSNLQKPHARCPPWNPEEDEVRRLY